MKKLTAISVLLVFVVACGVTYDLPVMYKKNYTVGTNDSLRFDGYYTSEWEMRMTERVRPIFLYRNGSVWFGEEVFYPKVLEESIRKGVAHSWGNYKIAGDTIYIERFQFYESTNNYRRVTMKGIIHSNSIKWISHQENRQNPEESDYTTIFQSSLFKPDSSENWTRTRAQFNK